MKAPAFAVAALCLAAAALGFSDYGMLGFPDGHLTSYERETRALRLAAIAANLVFAVGALAVGFSWVRFPRALAWPLAAAGIVLVAVPSLVLPRCPGITACSALYETVTGHPPDHGIGG